MLLVAGGISRCREKQRKESSRLQAVNRKLTAMNKLLILSLLLFSVILVVIINCQSPCFWCELASVGVIESF